MRELSQRRRFYYAFALGNYVDARRELSAARPTGLRERALFLLLWCACVVYNRRWARELMRDEEMAHEAALAR